MSDSNWSWKKLLKELGIFRRASGKKPHQKVQRSLLLESLETRQMMSASPEVFLGDRASVCVDAPLTRTGLVVDPNAVPAQIVVDYGDGGQRQALSLAPDQTFAIEHSYTAPGNYLVSVLVTDTAGDTGSGSLQVIVAPDVRPLQPLAARSIGSPSALDEEVGLASTVVVNTSDINPAVYGQIVTFTANVSAASPGSGTPTGQVQFYNGNQALGGPLDLNDGGIATLQCSNLPVGNDAITAVYLGDGNFLGSTSVALTQEVGMATTVNLANSSPNPSVYGQPVTIMASVHAVTPGCDSTPIDTAPAGMVQFWDSGDTGVTPLGDITLNGSGVATLVDSSLAAGTHDIWAVYLGNASFLGSTSEDLSQTVNAADTSIGLSSIAPTPPIAGNDVFLTANVSVSAPGSGTPTGQVEFSAMGLPDHYAPVINGVATANVGHLPAGETDVTITYLPDNGNCNGSSTNAPVLVWQNTKTTLTASANSVLYGNDLILTATVASDLGNAGLTSSNGFVEFWDGGVGPGNGTDLGGGCATLPGSVTVDLSNLSVGNHTLFAVYSGDEVYSLPSQSAPLNLLVQANTTVQGSDGSLVFGQAGNLTVQVVPGTSGGQLPSGSVDFYDNTDSKHLGSVTIDGNGTATLQLNGTELSFGNDSITATYAGDGNYLGSNATFLEHVLQTTTQVTLDASVDNGDHWGQSTAVVGQGLMVCARVGGDAPHSPTPTGSVVLYDDSQTDSWGNPLVVGTATTLANGTATWSLANLPLGQHQLQAAYTSDDSAFVDGSLGNDTINVAQASSVTISSSDPNPSQYAQNVTFTANVTAMVPGNGAPSGSVDFFDTTAGKDLGTVTLDDSGNALLTEVSFQTRGPHVVTASYSGDANFVPSGNSVLQTVIGISTSLGNLTIQPVSPAAGDPIEVDAPLSDGDLSSMGGTAQLLDNGNSIATADVATSGGDLQFGNLTLHPGNHALQVVYSGDDTHEGCTSPVLDQTIRFSTTTTLFVEDSTSPNPSTINQTVYFVAQVSYTSNAPTGSTLTPANGYVVLFDQTANQTIGNAVPLNPAGCGTLTGSATLSTSALTVGNHALEALFLGTQDLASSVSNPITQVVLPLSTTTSLNLTGCLTFAYGDLQTLTATVQVPQGDFTPTDGSVWFHDNFGNMPSSNLSLDNGGCGTVILATGNLPVGMYDITASYSGNDCLSDSTSGDVTLIIQQASTTVSGSDGNLVAGQAGNLTVQILPGTSGGQMPSGSVEFFYSSDNGNLDLGPATVDGNGTATLQLNGTELPPGDDTITATYAGDGNYLGNLTVFLEHVQPGVPIAAQLTLTSSTDTGAADQSTAVFGQSVTFTATVTSDAPGGGTPTGTVVLYDSQNAMVVGNAVTLDGGSAAWTIGNLSLGSHALQAAYVSDSPAFGNATGSYVEIIAQATSTTLASSDPDPSLYGGNVTLAATVTAVDPSNGTPTGSVDFQDTTTGTDYGPQPLVGNVATLHVPLTGIGNHTITATFSGDTNFAPSGDTRQQEVDGLPVVLTLSPLPSPPAPNTPFEFDAQVSAADAYGMATGSAVLYIDGSYANTATPDGGVLRFENLTLGTGNHTFDVQYLGDDAHAAGEARIVQSVEPDIQVTVDATPEGSSALFTITRTHADTDTYVNYQTADDTAMAGDGYAATTGALHFAPGEKSKTLAVDTLFEQIYHGDDDFYLTVSDSMNNYDSATATAHVERVVPTLQIGNATVVEGQTAQFTATISRPSITDQTFDYFTFDDTAQEGVNYTQPDDETLTIPGCQTQATISIPTIEDGVYSTTAKTFDLLAVNEAGGDFGNQATGTIQEASALPTISLGNLTVGEGEWANFQLTLSQPCDTAVTVHAATANGTGVDGYDFIGLDDTVTFQPGETSETVPVLARMKGLYTGDHTFSLTADSPSLGTLAEDSATATIVGAVPTLSLGDVSVREGDTAQFDVTLSRAVAQSLSVDYTVGGGTAVPGVQYDATGGTLVFPVGVTQEWINVPTKNDGWYRGDTTYAVALQNAHGAPLADVAATGTIQDLQSGYVTAADCWAEPGENLVFAVHPIFPHTLPITAAYSVDADDGVTGAAGTLTFAAYDSNPQSVFVGTSLTTSSDDQTLYFMTGDQVAGTGTVYRSPPVVTLDDAAAGGTIFLQAGQTDVIGLSLSRPTHTSVTAICELANGTATGGVDFNPSGNQAVTFAPTPAGSSDRPHATIDLTTFDDPAIPHDGTQRTFSLKLSSVQGADLPDARRCTVNYAICYAPPAVTPYVSINAAAADPGQPVRFTFTLNRPWAGLDDNGNPTNVLVVSYRLADGTAHAGVDYDPGDPNAEHSVSLCWEQGITSATVLVPTKVDPANHGNDQFTFQADDPADGTQTVPGVIHGPPGVTLAIGPAHAYSGPAPGTSTPASRSQANVAYADAGVDIAAKPVAAGDDVTITITPAAAANYDTYYTVHLEDDTAHAGDDYTDIGEVTVPFDANSTAPKTVTVHTNVKLYDGNTKFKVVVCDGAADDGTDTGNDVIAGVGNATIVGDSGNLTIYSYDGTTVPDAGKVDPGAFLLPGSSSDPRATLNELEVKLPEAGRYKLLHNGGDVHVYEADKTEYDGREITAAQAGMWNYSLAGSATSTDFTLVVCTDGWESEPTDEAKATTGAYHIFRISAIPDAEDITAKNQAGNAAAVDAGAENYLVVQVAFPNNTTAPIPNAAYTWDVSGTAVGTFNPSAQRDPVTPYATSNTYILFVWSSDGTQTVTVDVVNASGKQCLTATFDVYKPDLAESDVEAFDKTVVPPNGGSLRWSHGAVMHIGLDGLTSVRYGDRDTGEPGIRISDTPFDTGGYEYEWLQVVDTMLLAGGEVLSSPLPALDVGFPYPFKDDANSLVDYPGEDVPFGNARNYSVNFQATTYLMCRPTAARDSSGVWIPLGSVTWGADMSWFVSDDSRRSRLLTGCRHTPSGCLDLTDRFPHWISIAPYHGSISGGG